MKILFVTREETHETQYGMTKSTTPIISQLRKNGHIVDYLAPKDLTDNALPNTFGLIQVFFQHVIYKVWKKPSSWIAYAFFERIKMGALAANISKTKNYSHIHFQDPIIASGYWLFTLCNRSKNTRWGFSEHGFGAYIKNRTGILIQPHVKFFLQRLEKKMSLTANWVISPSFLGTQQLANDLKMTVIPKSWHSIHHARPSINSYSKQIARDTLNWNKNVFYIVSVGQFIELKQFPLLIEACSKTTCEKKLQLVILGSGDTSQLDNAIKTHHLTHSPMILFTDDIGLYLSAADLYVSTSSTESFGMANLEAAVIGVPIICTAVDAVPEIMHNGATLVSTTVQSIKNAIQDTVNNPKILQKMSQSSYQLGKNHPDIINVAKEYENIYLNSN